MVRKKSKTQNIKRAGVNSASPLNVEVKETCKGNEIHPNKPRRDFIGASLFIGASRSTNWIKPIVAAVTLPVHAQTSSPSNEICGNPSGSIRIDYTGSADSFNLPQGVCSIRVIGSGGGGGGGVFYSGGNAERSEVVISGLIPGETLAVIVGGGGGGAVNSAPGTLSGPKAPATGFGGGGFGADNGTNGQSILYPLGPFTFAGGGGGGSTTLSSSNGSLEASGGGGASNYDLTGGSGGGTNGGTGAPYSAGGNANLGNGALGGIQVLSNEKYSYAANGNPGYVIISWPP